jgi:MoxR-like ATPase
MTSLKIPTSKITNQTTRESKSMGCQILESAKYVKSQVFKMDVGVDIAYACMISRLPCLFVGNPGTGKSHTFKLVAKMFGERDKDWFYQSITAKTSPEKLFGGIIAEQMLNGVETYNLSVGAATKAGVIFDELFKSQHPAMMNTLLNFFDEEPTIFSGGKNVTPEWQYAFTTTNFEDLSDDLRYDPLWDRMAAKFVVNNLSHADSRTALSMVMIQRNVNQDLPKLTIKDLELARNVASNIEVSDDIIDTFYEKVLPILEKCCYISQRKINSIFIGKTGCPSILQAIAYMTGGLSSDTLAYIHYFVWQDRQKLNKLIDEVTSAVTLPIIRVYRNIKKDLETLLSELQAGKYPQYEVAKQKTDIILEACKTSASAYSNNDKKKVPEELRKGVMQLTKDINEKVSSMVNKVLDDVEF